LGKGTNRSLLEAACRALCTQEPVRQVSYTAIKHQISVERATHTGRPLVQDPPRDVSGTPPPAPARGGRDTRGAYLGGVSQFSLEALTRAASAGDTTGAGDVQEDG